MVGCVVAMNDRRLDLSVRGTRDMLVLRGQRGQCQDAAGSERSREPAELARKHSGIINAAHAGVKRGAGTEPACGPSLPMSKAP